MNNVPFRTESFLKRDGVVHGFFGRKGGVSRGIYESLNGGFGSGDEREAVAENRRLISSSLGAEELITAFQTHSARVVEAREAWMPGESPHADAMVTTRRGLALAILAADCMPVLFCDAQARVIGAAHAGWKGALSGVLEATIEAMIGLGATRTGISAAIGPAISGESYEVGPEYRERFLQLEETNARFFLPADRDGHFLFDLPGYATARLARARIGIVANLGACSYREATEYFSYRRSLRRGEKNYGRNVSAILLSS